MFGSKLLQCHGCMIMREQQPTVRQLHYSVSRLNQPEQKVANSGETSSWVRQRSSPRLHMESRRKPYVKAPDDVLISVKAASVNPMDVAMTGWYGDNILSLYQQAKRVQTAGPSALCSGRQAGAKVEVLGRDFSGVIEAVGHGVHRFKPGDEVFGATSPIVEGSHSLYTITSQQDICKKPSNLSHIEAASIPYSALTFLSGYNCVSKCTRDKKPQRVHLNSAAGGIGSFALQYLKAIGCDVTVSVSKSAAEVIAKFNPDHILDYQSPNYQEDLQKLAGFDVAFDFAGDESAMSCVRPQGWFVTAVSPLLQLTDRNGLLLGTASAATQYAQKAAQALYNHGVYYSWAFFTPNRSALEDIKAMMEDGKISAVVDEIFPFQSTPEAYEKVSKGKGRGKVVIDMTSS